MVSVFEGQLTRTWFFQNEDKKHVLNLYHNTVSGARSAMIDQQEIKGSQGSSSLMMDSKGHRIYFMIGQLPAYLEIRRSGWTGFGYRCVINDNEIKEVTDGVLDYDLQFHVKVLDYSYTGEEPPVAWFLLKTRRNTDGVQTTVHRRFSEFAELNVQIKQNMKGHHLCDTLPTLPNKPSKRFTDHKDPAFIQDRSFKLESYLCNMVSIPHVANMVCMKAFLGIMDEVREHSLTFHLPTLGMSLQQQSSELPGESGALPCMVRMIEKPELCTGVRIGDHLSRINGVSLADMTFFAVIRRIKSVARPVVIHFIQEIKEPSSASADKEDTRAPATSPPIPAPAPKPNPTSTQPDASSLLGWDIDPAEKIHAPAISPPKPAPAPKSTQPDAPLLVDKEPAGETSARTATAPSASTKSALPPSQSTLPAQALVTVTAVPTATATSATTSITAKTSSLENNPASAAAANVAPNTAFDAVAFTKQDRGAMTVFLQHSTELLHGNARLQQVMRTVAAHDRTLQMLVSKEKECPSLFWFYPKKPELRRWLSDPAKCLFQDTLMMVVVCPVTLCVVECGPGGVGWEVNKPKEWVKKWGPAILFSIYVMQAAVVAGRLVGIPLPPVPGAGGIKEALGLKGMLGDVFSTGANQVNLKDSLKALQDSTAAALDQTPASRALCAGLQTTPSDGSSPADAPLPADLPMQMVGEAYKAIHSFLLTFGPLEDQLRGHMVRERNLDGDMEWVSVQGRDAWKQKQTAFSAETQRSSTVSAAPAAPITLVVPDTRLSPIVLSCTPTWLGEKLATAGFSTELVQLCDRLLVQQEGISEKRLACMPSTRFHDEYLIQLGITSTDLRMELLDLHRELRSKGEATPTSSAHRAEVKKVAAAEFTEEDRQLLRQLKLQQRAPEPTTTHTVDRGNQMQYTASAFSQQGPQGAQDQQQLARRIAELEVRLARAEGVVTEHITDTALQLEDVHGRVDQLTPPAAGSRSNSGKRSK